MSRGTLDPGPLLPPFAYRAFTSYGLPFQVLRLGFFTLLPVLNPKEVASSGLGSSLFARRYYGNLV